MALGSPSSVSRVHGRPWPNTSKPAPGHKIFPNLLRKLPVTRSNQVWAMDITYIPMARGFLYLTAVVDWCSRKVLAWRLSITMDGHLLHRGRRGRHGPLRQAGYLQYGPGLGEFTALIGAGIKISMDGKGAWRDNVFADAALRVVERIWRSVKYEEVYLRA